MKSIRNLRANTTRGLSVFKISDHTSKKSKALSVFRRASTKNTVQSDVLGPVLEDEDEEELSEQQPVQNKIITKFPEFVHLHRALDSNSTIEKEERERHLHTSGISQLTVNQLRNELNLVPEKEIIPKNESNRMLMYECFFSSILFAAAIVGGYFLFFKNKVHETTRLEAQIGFPLIYGNVTLKRIDSYDPGDIPVFLDFLGISNHFIPEMLHKCLGLNGVSIDKFNTLNQVSIMVVSHFQIITLVGSIFIAKST